ncbi:MAG: hypothetical protein DDT22_00484 [candidate division WS2 bacterium]|nr:hypothetical protein [Candidatus Lithacetigena glycinireducens]MBT9174819.1 hypothetical protein [Candidatus Lithacetigena glycinireducens]
MKIKQSFWIAFSFLIIVVLLVLQFKTRVPLLREVGPTSSREAITYLRTLNEKKDSLLKEIEKLNFKILELNEVSMRKEDFEKSLNQEISKWEALLGLKGITGAGLEISITPMKNQVLSVETFIDLVNDLWGGGALAISINKSRIGWNSYLYQSGNQLSISGRLVDAPFLVEAIGPTEVLESVLRIPGGFEQKMLIQGVELKISIKNNMIISAGGIQ